MPKVYIATDHAGYSLKEVLMPYLSSRGYTVEDCGAFSLQEDDDYTDYVRPCAQKVVADHGSFGIIIGASGQGEAMAANRVVGVRAAVYYGDPSIKQTDAQGNELTLLASVRVHNDANVLSLGARFLTHEEALRAVDVFLSTSFSGEARHSRRIEKLG